MANYKIYFKRSVEKDLSSIPSKDVQIIMARIEQHVTNPRPPECEKLTGEDKYRLRQGRYRILYSLWDKNLTIWIIKVAHRKDVYRY